MSRENALIKDVEIRGPNGRSVDCWTKTRVNSKTDKVSYVWAIEDFHYFYNEKNEMFSPVFSSADNNDCKWYLHLKNKIKRDNEEYIALYLCLKDINARSEKVSVDWKFSILNGKREVKMVKNSTRHKFSKNCNSWGWEQYICKKQLFNETDSTPSDLLPDGILHIFCEITLHVVEEDDVIDITSYNCRSLLLNDSTGLADDFNILYSTKDFSDVTLSVNGTDFAAHKCVLSARSPVFAAMFRNKMSESKLNLVKITDLSPDVVDKMLRYLYTGELYNIWKMAAELLIAADKYDIPKLKNQCEMILCERLTISNASEIFKLADMYHAVELKDKAKDIIARYAYNASLTFWKDVLSTNTEIIEMILKPELLKKFQTTSVTK